MVYHDQYRNKTNKRSREFETLNESFSKKKQFFKAEPFEIDCEESDYERNPKKWYESEEQQVYSPKESNEGTDDRYSQNPDYEVSRSPSVCNLFQLLNPVEDEIEYEEKPELENEYKQWRK